MSVRLIATLGVAVGALAAGTAATAQPVMTYEQQQAYEYAQQGVQQPITPPTPPVVYTEQPVVQPIPDTYREFGDADGEAAAGADYQVEERQVFRHPAPGYPPMAEAMPPQPVPQPAFDRAGWIDECMQRYHEAYGRKRNGQAIGGVVGAAAGGLIGNRIAGRGDRLAGTLIGAGVGAAAGLAVGSAADAAGRRRDRDEAQAYCEDYLASYTAGGYGQGQPYYGVQYASAQGYYGYPYPGGYYPQAACGCAQQMMLVPVVVPVEQHAVVREYVTERTVNVPVTTYEEVTVRHRAIPARPRQTKPQPTKPVRYSKGN